TGRRFTAGEPKDTDLGLLSRHHDSLYRAKPRGKHVRPPMIVYPAESGMHHCGQEATNLRISPLACSSLAAGAVSLAGGPVAGRSAINNPPVKRPNSGSRQMRGSRSSAAKTRASANKMPPSVPAMAI